MTDVEIRKSAISAQVIAVLHDGILQAERVVVDRLRPGVGGAELEAACETLIRGNPERVVTRVAGALGLRDVAERRAGQYRARLRKRLVRAHPVDRLVDVATDGKMRAL